MRQFISKNKRWFGYIFYCAILTVGLLYYRFPSDALRDYLQIRANSLDTPLSLSIGRIKPWPSFGLKLGQTEISLKDQPNIKLFRADSLLIRPSIWSFLQGKFKFSFNCLAYDGVLKGCAHFIENSIKAPFTASIELKDISIGDYGNLQGLISRHVKGNLGGTIIYSGQYNTLINGTGEADLRISKGQVKLSRRILNFKSIDFNELWIKIILKKQKINMTHVELKGRNIHGTLSGAISLKKEFMKSSLELRGTIEPFTDFFKGLTGTRDTMKFFKQRLKRGRLSFIIHGTLAEPIIKFI
jgi:type II secretion system protein N